MKISKKTYISFGIFLVFALILMIMLVQTIGLNQLSVFEELKENELEWGKNILEQCKLPHERYAEMKEHLFKAEQELLNDNPINAAKHFNVVRPLLGTCAFELSGKPHPFETAFGQAVLILGGITGGITLVSFLRDILIRRSSSKGFSN